jgi:uncharacterized membrane protein YkvA (DUF1232 family)
MWKRIALIWALVRSDALLLWRALRHPRAPGWLKLGAAGVVLYLVSPIDLIPDFIPFVGVLDDVALVPLAIRFLPRPRRVRAMWSTSEHDAPLGSAQYSTSTTASKRYPAPRSVTSSCGCEGSASILRRRRRICTSMLRS